MKLNENIQGFVVFFNSESRYYKHDHTKEELDFFIDELGIYDYEKVITAFKKHRLDQDRGRFFPKIADIAYQYCNLPKNNNYIAISDKRLINRSVGERWTNKIYAIIQNVENGKWVTSREVSKRLVKKWPHGLYKHTTNDEIKKVWQ